MKVSKVQKVSTKGTQPRPTVGKCRCGQELVWVWFAGKKARMVKWCQACGRAAEEA
jgi:hypothetical protein